jgi:hypothetical protein
MYKLKGITHFEGRQILDCLGAQNEGKASISEIRKMLGLIDKIEEVGKGVPSESVNDMNKIIDTFSDEAKKTLTKADVEKKQDVIWDTIYIAELVLENKEFETIKKAFDDISDKRALPRDLRYARRFDRFYKALEKTESFDVNQKKDDQVAKEDK